MSGIKRRACEADRKHQAMHKEKAGHSYYILNLQKIPDMQSMLKSTDYILLMNWQKWQSVKWKIYLMMAMESGVSNR